MGVIKISEGITFAEVGDRIQYFCNQASEIKKVYKSNEVVGEALYRSLMEKQDIDYKTLNYQKNYDLVHSHLPLNLYWGYFHHLHFYSGRLNDKKIIWNLSEFSEGRTWFKNACVLNGIENEVNFIDSLKDTERLDVNIVSGLTPDVLTEKLDNDLYNFFYMIYMGSYTEYFEHFTIFNVAQYLSKTTDDVKQLLKKLLNYEFITVERKGK